jgi:hypothetical protein
MPEGVVLLAALCEHVLGVCRTAHDFAEVVDQVRFLARTLIGVVQLYGKARCTMSKRNFYEQSFFSRR